MVKCHQCSLKHGHCKESLKVCTSDVGFGGLEPLFYTSVKKAEIWGTVIRALCLSVPPGVKPSAQVPLVPVQLSMGYPCVLVEIDF